MPALAGRSVYGLIWTTTPWTMPANMAIAFNPKYEYAAVDVGGDVYIVAEDLLKVTAEKVRLDRLPRSSPHSPAPPSSGRFSAIPSWSAIRSAFWRTM